MKYLIDSNSLIDADLKWYRPKVFSSVWAFLANNINIEMSSFVFAEIKYPDDLRNWTNTNFKTKQVIVNPKMISKYNEVMDWISNCNRWSPAGISQWQSPDKADPWLIATAMLNNDVIVTMDGNGRATMPDIGSDSSREPKIGAVANQFGVRTIALYDMLDELKLNI